MGAGKRVKQFAERFGQGQFVRGRPKFECPEGGADYYGIKVRGTIRKDHEGYWYLGITNKTQVQGIKNYLGDEHCFIVVSVKGLNIYSIYNPHRKLYDPTIPSGLGQKGEEIGVTVRRLSRSEFLSGSTKTGKLPFELIVDRSGNSGLLEIGTSLIPVVRIDELRWNRGQTNAPALVFAIRDHQGKEHFFKIAHHGYRDPFLGIRSGGFKRIEKMEYNPEKGLLTVTYYKGGTYKTKIWLKAPIFKEYEELKVSFFKGLSLEKVEGIVSRDSYAGINWDPYVDFTEKAFLGPKSSTRC